MNYTAIKFVKRPTGLITPDVFEMVTMESPSLSCGEMLLKQTHMHMAPAMRGWMDDDGENYLTPLSIGEIMRSVGVAEVVETQNESFPVGTRVFGPTGWREYLVSDGTGLTTLPPEIPAEVVLAVLSPGLSAYYGLMTLGQPKSGETLVVSGGAGAVGSLVGQLGKAEGMHVVGVAGSGEKCRWMEDELGFDHAINYKSPSLAEDLQKATPGGIDIFYENTGGPIQAAAYAQMNLRGRIVVCGMISEYNAAELSPGPNWLDINRKRLSIQGFVISDHMDKAPAMTQALTQLFLKGNLKYRVHKLKGIESAVDGINLLFSGGNEGKLIVEF
ncbi:MAG: NADP-dependent oxidoreductase [Pseudomonadota bacterium]